ncbi:MAG TPA: hypothetical protein VJH92_03335 [Candidatus Nanoarchaeia archaeon]|nr:hypothetical protein [Candidatus Nanoarchaeia archaeon]
MTSYRSEVSKAMRFLAEDSRAIFLGQTVGYPGSRFTYGTLEGIPMDKRIELPIMEEAQMGMSIGLALQGYVPISIYPRFDFLLLGLNQLVNHLDKFNEMSSGEYKPKVIIRTIIGSTKPLNPGPQHRQDYTSALKSMLTDVDVVKLDDPSLVFETYQKALDSNRSTVVVENGQLH